MRRLIFAFTFLAATVYAASTYTTNYTLEKPADGDSSTSWNSAFRDNMDTIDSQMKNNSDTTNNHINDTVGAHAATAISATSGADVCTSDTTVQGWLDCLNDLNAGIVTLDNPNYAVVTDGSSQLTTEQFLAPGRGGTGVGNTGTFTYGTNNLTFSTSATTALTLPTSGTVVTLAGSETLTNKTIDADLNPISNIGSTEITDDSIVNADINSAAAIARTKIGTGTADYVVINDGSGNLSEEATLAVTRGGTGSATQNFVDLTTGQSVGGIKTLTAKPLLQAGLEMDDETDASHSVTFTIPDLSADYTLTLPTTDGDTNQALITNGSGVLSWGAAGGYPAGSATESITGAGTITIDGTLKAQVLYVDGSGGAVSASTTPFGASPPGDNSEVVVCGRSDTNTVTLTHNDAADGCILNGNVVLGKYDCVTVIYNSTDDRYIEKTRSLK